MINIMVNHPELYYGARGFPVPQNMHLSLSYYFYGLGEILKKEPKNSWPTGSPQATGEQLVKYFEYPELIPVLNWLVEIKGISLIKHLWAIPPENLYALLVAPVSMSDALYGLSMLSFPLAFPQSKKFDHLKKYLSNVLSSYYKSDVDNHSTHLAALLLKMEVITVDNSDEDSESEIARTLKKSVYTQTTQFRLGTPDSHSCLCRSASTTISSQLFSGKGVLCRLSLDP